MKEDYTPQGLMTPEDKSDFPIWVQTIIAGTLLTCMSLFMGYLFAFGMELRSYVQCYRQYPTLTLEVQTLCKTQSATNSWWYLILASTLFFLFLWATSPESLKNPLRFWNRWYT